MQNLCFNIAGTFVLINKITERRQKMKYVGCPQCGHKLLEGENGSRVAVKCNKCKAIVTVEIKEDAVKLQVNKKE